MLPPFIAAAWRGVTGAAGGAYRFYWGQGLERDAVALTYYLLVSLLPAALGLGAIASLSVEPQVAVDRLREMTGPLGQDLSDQLLEAARRVRGDSPRLLVLSIAAMLWACAGGVGAIDTCIGRLSSSKPYSPLRGRLRAIALSAGLAMLTLAAASAFAYAAGVAGRLGVGARIAALAVNYALAYGLLVALYRLAPPPRRPRWRSAMIAAAPTALALLALTATVGVLLEQQAASSAGTRIAFGIAGAVLACGCAARVVIVGAATTVAIDRRTRDGRYVQA